MLPSYLYEQTADFVAEMISLGLLDEDDWTSGEVMEFINKFLRGFKYFRASEKIAFGINCEFLTFRFSDKFLSTMNEHLLAIGFQVADPAKILSIYRQEIVGLEGFNIYVLGYFDEMVRSAKKK